MVNHSEKQIYYTPIFYVLSQFSRSIRPGDYAIKVETVLSPNVKKNVFCCATINSKNIIIIHILNTNRVIQALKIHFDGYSADFAAEPNSLSTINIKWHGI